MQLEHETRTIPMDENYEATLKEWQDSGWGIVPNTKPLVTFQLCRQLGETGGMGISPNLALNDANVFVLKADGTLRDANGKQIGKA